MSLPTAHRTLLVSVLSGLAIFGCASRPVLRSTQALTRGAVLRLHRIAVVAPLADAEERRKVEDAFVGTLGDPRFVASHAVIPAGDANDALAIKRHFDDEGFDGALVLRVLDVSTSHRWPPEAGAGNYRGPGAAGYIPGGLDLKESFLLTLELYSLDHDRLAWKGTSRNMNPSRLERLVARVAPETVSDLEARGLLASPPE